MTIRAAALALALAGLALAQDAPPAETTGPHGGVVRSAGAARVEVLFEHDEVRVLALDAQGQPLDVRGAGGRVEVRFADAGRAPVSGALTPPGLSARLALGRVADGEATATLRLTALPGVEGEVTVEVPFRLARVIEHVCPMRCVPARPEPGACARCRMRLVPAPYVFACPAHPAVTSREEDVCWVCEAPLRKVSEAPPAVPRGGR